MRSSKWSAHGNLYLLVEPADGERLAPGDAARLAAAERTDGVLEILALEGSVADIAIWNPDGSRAEMSGNGTRIAARWLSELTGERDVLIRVGERVVGARVEGDRVVQELGEVVVGEPEIVAGIAVVPVSVGNPHAVVVGDPADLPRLGPLLERHERFQNRTNVQVARVDAPGRVTARVWERGVGETRSSGTSAAAVAAATHAEGTVIVSFPGGALQVELENGRARVTGPAERAK